MFILVNIYNCKEFIRCGITERIFFYQKWAVEQENKFSLFDRSGSLVP